MHDAKQAKAQPEGVNSAADHAEESPAPGELRPTILHLQRIVGNRNVQRMVGSAPGAPAPVRAAISAKGPGESLPQGYGALLSGVYGTNLDAVRVHTDPRSAEAADQAGAEAFAYGTDVFFGSGRYDPETSHGRHVIAHEVAHAVQQGPALAPPEETGHEHDDAERGAELAASQVERGVPSEVGRSPHRVQYFAQGTGEASRGGHAFMTEAALRNMNLDPAQARVGRMGNWERDLSQVLTPTTAGFVEAIMPILNIMAIKEFGRGINASSFGTYDPVEHLDNPAGLRGTDVIGQGPMRTDGVNPDRAGGNLSDAGGDSQAYADIDPRYRDPAQQTRGAIMNPNDAAAYQVDESGIPRYMGASKTWLVGTLKSAAKLGRQANVQGEEQLHGPRMFASGVHTLQDYFAHSNFCEIAINILIREGSLRVMNAQGALETLGTDRVLDTQVHANDAQGNPMAGNLAHAGREVLSTGTFNLSDTAASLLEEVKDHWILLNPFKEKTKGPSKLTEACLDYLDMNPGNPTDFSVIGTMAATRIRAVTETLDFAPDALLAPLNDLASSLENRQHTARDAYRWLSDHGPLDILKRRAKEIPLVGERVAAAIESIQDTIRETVEDVLGEAWNWVVDEGVKKIEGVIEKIRSQTNVENKKAPRDGDPISNWVAKKFGNVSDMYDPATGQPLNGIAPASYTPPSHTQVAKDHGELHSPVQDGHAEESGHDDHGHAHISAWLNPLAQQIAAMATDAVGVPVKRVWDRVDAGERIADNDRGLVDIETEVDKYFQHPADIPGTWKPLFLARLQSRVLGPELLEQLSHSRAGTPAPPAAAGAAR